MSINDTAALHVGEVVHALASGLTISVGGSGLTGAARVLHRGDEFVLTSAMVDASRDRDGRIGWPALIDDEAAQIATWGVRMLAPGAKPLDSFEPWEVVGDETWVRERNLARQRAWALPTQEARREAFAEIERRFGPAPATSQTIATVPAPDPGAQITGGPR